MDAAATNATAHQGAGTRLARTQVRLSLAALAALVSTCLGVSLLAHFSPVMPSYVAWQHRRHQQINGVYIYGAEYADTGDYVLTGLLPVADYARGGAYFLGDSKMVVTLMPWKLSPAERALIHNYSQGALTHREGFYFVKNLVEEQGLLEAGGEKTTVILGLYFGMTHQALPSFTFFRRHGWYRFDPRNGLRLGPSNRFTRFLLRERIYANQFLRIVTLWTDQIRVPEEPNPPDHRANWARVMGPNWRENMKVELEYLAKLLDYLQARRVHVKAVFVPHPGWEFDLPFCTEYRQSVMPLLEARKIPVTDLAHLLPDEDFTDASHSRYTGQLKIHEICRELALRALADTGMRPPAQTNR